MMKSLASLPPVVPFFALGLGLFAPGGWLLQRSHAAANRELRTLGRLVDERTWLGNQSPSLNALNEAALAEEVQAAVTVLDELKQAGRNNAAGEPRPAGPTEAFFELADFVGRLRARADAAQVQIKVNERFGFGSYTVAGPPGEQIASVHRQQLAIEDLVGELIESGPRALLAVRREKSPANTPATPGGWPDDFFEPHRQRSTPTPAGLEADGYQLEFTGQTQVLREFLNRLAAGRLPVVVRGVEVERFDASAGSNRTAKPGGAEKTALSPLVDPGLTRFSVTLEVVRLTDNPGESAP